METQNEPGVCICLQEHTVVHRVLQDSTTVFWWLGDSCFQDAEPEQCSKDGYLILLAFVWWKELLPASSNSVSLH